MFETSREFFKNLRRLTSRANFRPKDFSRFVFLPRALSAGWISFDRKGRNRDKFANASRGYRKTYTDLLPLVPGPPRVRHGWQNQLHTHHVLSTFDKSWSQDRTGPCWGAGTNQRLGRVGDACVCACVSACCFPADQHSVEMRLWHGGCPMSPLRCVWKSVRTVVAVGRARPSPDARINRKTATGAQFSPTESNRLCYKLLSMFLLVYSL